MCKSADLLLMVLDATKPWHHRDILTRELESVGMRLNRCAARACVSVSVCACSCVYACVCLYVPYDAGAGEC